MLQPNRSKLRAINIHFSEEFAYVHCVKGVCIRSYSGPVRIRENARKMWTRITPNTDSSYKVALNV